MPLALTHGITGSYFGLSVVGPAAPLRATVSTRRLIDGQSRFGSACQVGEEEHAGRVGVASLLFVKSWPWSGVIYVNVDVSAVASMLHTINAS
jgi:hypothetical protein